MARVVWVFVLFDGVADVEGFARLDVVEILLHIERNAVDNRPRRVVDEFEFDVLEVFAHEFAGAEVHNVASTEYRLLVAGPERGELVQASQKFGSNFFELHVCVDVDLGSQLVWRDCFRHIILKSAGKFGNVFLFHRKSDGIGVSAEVFEQVASGFDGLIDVVALHREPVASPFESVSTTAGL